MLRGGVVPPAPTAEEFQGPLVDCMDMFAYFGFEEQVGASPGARPGPTRPTDEHPFSGRLSSSSRASS